MQKGWGWGADIKSYGTESPYLIKAGFQEMDSHLPFQT